MEGRYDSHTSVPSGGPVRWALQDWRANVALDSRIVLVGFRFAQWMHHRAGFAGRVWCVGHRLVSSLVVGVELAPEMVAGPRLVLHHPHGIVVNPRTLLGADCVLRQQVTIGNLVRAGVPTDAPVVGDGVEFGAGAVVIGPVTIGDGARIGALALVREDVPAHAVAVGNPARLVRHAP